MIPTKPAAASSGRPVSRAKSSHARQKVKESNAMMQYRDCSLFNATRHKEQEDNKLLRTQQKLDKQSNIFANEVIKLKNRQRKLAAAQKRMCVTAMQKYSVYLIQALYRGYHDRQVCRKMRSIRLLSAFLPRRYHFRKRARASRMIIRVYRRFVFFRTIQHYHKLFQKAMKIQRCYRAYYRLRRAIIRRFSMITWQHVALFGVCRATQVLDPLAKPKRLIYRVFASFYARLRRRRLENHLNCYRLFYGLFFAETPAAKRHIQSRASSILNKRANTFQAGRQSIIHKIDVEVLSLKISRAPMNVYKRVNAAATHDVLHHLRGQVIADQMNQMRFANRRKPSLLAMSPPHRNSSLLQINASMRKGSALAPAPPSSLSLAHRASLNLNTPAITPPSFTASPSIPPKTFQRKNSARRKNSERTYSVTALNALGSIEEGKRAGKDSTISQLGTALPTFDDVFNDYVMPKRLIKYRSTTQIDPNSMFANLKVEGSDKLVPFELRGNYRLKSIAEVVQCLQDLSAIAMKNPLLLQNPFDRSVFRDDLTRQTKPDKSPRFIETFLPFNGTFEHSIFRRGAMSYDYESSAVYNQLSDLANSSGKRALIRQHVIKTSAVEYEEARYKRRHFMNPMRKNQPAPPEFDVATLDAQFLESVESKFDLTKKNTTFKKRKRFKNPKGIGIGEGEGSTSTISVKEQENLIRHKISKLREDILQQQEIIGALNDSSSDEDNESDTSTTSSSSSRSIASRSSEGSDDDEFTPATATSTIATTSISATPIPDPSAVNATFRATPPQNPVPSFQRRRNLSIHN